MGPNQIKSFFTAKETINKIKRQPTEWERIYLQTLQTTRGKISKIYKQLTQLNVEKKKKSNQQMGRRLT